MFPQGYFLIRNLVQSVLLILCVCVAQDVRAQVQMGFSIWELVSEGSCKETMSFLGEKEYLIESGDQLLTKAYKFKQYRNTDFYVFSQRTTSNNGLPNCGGVVGTKKGTRIKTYAKFNADNTEMSLYLEPDEEKPLDIVFRKR